jgi:hypothetical protein
MTTYRLVKDTYGTLCGPDGRAREEAWLDAGTIVRRPASPRSDASPWTGGAMGNRPEGVHVRDEIGAHWVLPADTVMELILG